MIESLLSKTLSSHTYNYTSNDILSGVFLWIYLCKNFASFHASMRSQMFYKIDVLEISSKLIGKHLHQTLLTPAQMFFR